MIFQPEEHSSESYIPPSNIYGLVQSYFKHMDLILDVEEPTSRQFIEKSYDNLATFLCQPKLDFPNIHLPRPFDLNVKELQELSDVLMLDCCGLMLNLSGNSVDIVELLTDVFNNSVPVSPLAIPTHLIWEMVEDQESADDIICEFFEENGWFSISDHLINHIEINYSLPKGSVVLDNFITRCKGQGEDVIYPQDETIFGVEDMVRSWSDEFVENFFGIQQPETLYINSGMQNLITPIIDNLFKIRKEVQIRLASTHQRKN